MVRVSLVVNNNPFSSNEFQSCLLVLGNTQCSRFSVFHAFQMVLSLNRLWREIRVDIGSPAPEQLSMHTEVGGTAFISCRTVNRISHSYKTANYCFNSIQLYSLQGKHKNNKDAKKIRHQVKCSKSLTAQ